jgi:hypothetical protein
MGNPYLYAFMIGPMWVFTGVMIVLTARLNADTARILRMGVGSSILAYVLGSLGVCVSILGAVVIALAGRAILYA